MTAFDQPPRDGMLMLRCTAHGTPIAWINPPLPPEGAPVRCIPACDEAEIEATYVERDQLRAELEVAQAAIACWHEHCAALEARLAEMPKPKEGEST